MSVISVFIIILGILYISILYYKNNLRKVWPIHVLRELISFFTKPLFIPILSILMSILNCKNGKNYFNNDIKCKSDWKTYFNYIIAIISSFLFIFETYLIEKIFFETQFSNNNPMAKFTSESDVYFLISKIILIILFTFWNDEKNEWLLVIILFSLSLLNLFIFISMSPYYDKRIIKVFGILFTIFFWTNTVLLWGKICKKTNFDGCIGLFGIGVPILIILIISNDKMFEGNNIFSLNKINSGIQAIKIIKELLYLIDTKDSNRSSKLILTSYINQSEERCIESDCPIKKYLSTLENNKIDAPVFLLQHCEYVFQNSISKFPLETKLRIFYAFFLISRLNKKKQASNELIIASNYPMSFEDEFIIFRYKKILEEYIASDGDDDENLDMVSNLEYTNYYKSFKNSIMKVSSLYIDFWTLLLNPNQDIHEDLTHLNDYGAEINKLVEDINISFDKMQKFKVNDPEVINYYSDFLNDILNDKEKADKYKKLLLETEIIVQTNTEKEKNKILNIETLLLNDEYNYIILSAKPEKFGIITNISLGICPIFGYSKNEIIGKTIEFLMPDIYQKTHREVLKEKLKEFKKNLFSTSEQKITYNEIYTFGKNKSKYLIQINIKPSLFQTETDENIFITKLWQEKCSFSSSTKSTCFLITNNLLKIQYFTPNAITLLGLTSSLINSNIEITEYIKQFYEEFLKYIVDHQQHTPEEKMQLKRAILIKKFRNPIIINWKRPDIINHSPTNEPQKTSESNDFKNHFIFNLRKSTPSISNYNNTSFIGTNQKKPPIKTLTSSVIKKSSTPNQVQPSNNLVNLNNNMQSNIINQDDIFMLTVSIAKIKNHHEGFIFKFEGLKNKTKPHLGTSIFNSFIMSHRKRDIEHHVKKDSTESLAYFTKGQNYNKNNYDFKEKSCNESITPKEAEVSNFSNIFKVDKNYIPESKNIFQLDFKNMSFIIKNDDESIRDYLKEEAIKKLQNNNKSIENDEEEEEESESDENDFSNISSSLNSSERNSNTKRDKEKTKINLENSGIKLRNDEYYRVNMSPIKYSKYDFVKLMVVDIPDYKKISQVELKMTGEKENDFLKQTTNNQQGKTPIIKTDFTKFVNVDSLDSKINQTIIIKQIEYSLGKEETQPSIVRLRIISFIVFIILIAIGLSLLYTILYCHKIIKENIILIINSYDLIAYNCLGTYYSKELVLLNNENYTKFPYDNRDEYINSILNNTLKIFIKEHELITYMISSFLKISSKNYQYLIVDTINTYIIEDDFNITSYSMIIDNSFIEANSALFHIGHKNISEIIPTNFYVFYYIYNSMNDIFIAYEKQAQTYLNEIKYKIHDLEIILIIVVIICILMNVLCYFLISFAYDLIAQRKESYLEVFFEIGTPVIKSSLEKCEKFIKKINEENNNDNESTDSFDNDIISSENHINQNDKRNKEKGKKGVRKTNSSRETKVFKIIMSMFFFAVSLFSCIIFIFDFIWLDDSKIFMLCYQKIIGLKNRYIMTFNTLREYMFDYTLKVNSTDSLSFLNSILDRLYIIQTEYLRYITDKRSVIPGGFQKKYEEILLTNPCKYSNYFKSENDCLKFMSKSPSFGISVLSTYFLENVRMIKDSVQKRIKLQKLSNFTFNLTLTGTKEAKKLWPQGEENQKIYQKLDSIQEFLIDNNHLNTNILFIHLIIPYIDVVSNNLSKAILKGLKNNKLLYIILTCFYIIIMICIYIFIWIPFQTNLSQTIFKTKNMLTIIPKEVLSELTNIHKLLDLGQKNIKGSTKN